MVQKQGVLSTKHELEQNAGDRNTVMQYHREQKFVLLW